MSDFSSLFGRLPTTTAHAPGRVNLIGEHTDYNGGFVLPTAIPQQTCVELALRDDDRVQVASTAQAGTGVATYRLGSETPIRSWLDYVQGITQTLQQDGYTLRGFDARIDSSVPLGSGLSSSASLSVSLMRALRASCALDLDDVRMARLGQRSENEFVGARVGIMDPMAVCLADEGTALFLDARSLHFERVPLPTGADLVVINSGVEHDHSRGDYNTRRAECEEACRHLGIAQLRDLGPDDLPRVESLAEPWRRRARHVVTENARVLQAVVAMRQGDLVQLGRLFLASHQSMRDDYEVSVPPVDLLVDLAQGNPDVLGARLTGGGFGGSVVILTRRGTGRAVAADLARSYAERSGQRPRVLVPYSV